MGFLAGLLSVGSYLTDRDARSRFHQEFAAAPAKTALTFTGALSAAGFFLRIFIHLLGKIKIVKGPQLWQACGILAALCVVVDMRWRR
jgi:hypothetical protein